MDTFKSNKAIIKIYDAAVDATLWSSNEGALDQICHAIGANATVIFKKSYFQENPYAALDYSEAYRNKKDEFKKYMKIFDKYEAGQIDVLMQQPPHMIMRDEDATDLDINELNNREDYVCLKKIVGGVRRIGVRMHDNKGWFDCMLAIFDAKYSRVPDFAFSQTKLLLPHLTKAIAIGQTFEQLRQRYNAVLSTLDRVNVGFAIALPSQEIIVYNHEAERVISQANGISLTVNKHLRCRNNEKNDLLKQYLNEVISTAKGEGFHAEKLLTIPRLSGGQPFLFEVSPLRDADGELEKGLNGALITIIDPEHADSFKIERFAVLYKLTPAETNVCEMLIKGLSLDEIAEIRKVSYETVKSQVASIYSKAGINRRAELARLIIKVLPPIV